MLRRREKIKILSQHVRRYGLPAIVARRRRLAIMDAKINA